MISAQGVPYGHGNPGSELAVYESVDNEENQHENTYEELKDRADYTALNHKWNH